jgi:hypothetical protein
LKDRGVISSNFLSQSIPQINAGLIFNAADRPSGALGEGCVAFQYVNPNFFNYSFSLYSDLTNQDLYINTGTYGIAGANWRGWKKILNSSNISSYALPLTGGFITGNVGIGTTDTHGYKFAVNGDIHTKKVVVDLINWPDYVFKSSYNLKPLSEVKTYIDQNHHLPEMPSEKEVAEKGIDLGEMNKLLAKKVEELTLYMIESDRKQKSLEESNNLQQVINEKLEQRLKAIEAQRK